MTQQQSPNLHLPDGGKIQAIQTERSIRKMLKRSGAPTSLIEHFPPNRQLQIPTRQRSLGQLARPVHRHPHPDIRNQIFPRHRPSNPRPLPRRHPQGQSTHATKTTDATPNSPWNQLTCNSNSPPSRPTTPPSQIQPPPDTSSTTLPPSPSTPPRTPSNSDHQPRPLLQPTTFHRPITKTTLITTPFRLTQTNPQNHPF